MTVEIEGFTQLYDFSMTLSGSDKIPGMGRAMNLPVRGITSNGHVHQLYLSTGSTYTGNGTFSEMELLADFHRMGAHQQVTLLAPKDTSGMWDAIEKGQLSFRFLLRAWNLRNPRSWHTIILSTQDSYLYGRRKVGSDLEGLIVKFSGASVEFAKKSGDGPGAEDYYPAVGGPRTYYAF